MSLSLSFLVTSLSSLAMSFSSFSSLFGVTMSFSAMVSSFSAMSSSFSVILSPFLSLFCSLMVLFDPLFWSSLKFKGSSGDALFFETSLLPDSFVFSDSFFECSLTSPFLLESQPLTLFRDVLPFSVIPSSFSPSLSAILSSFSVMSSSFLVTSLSSLAMSSSFSSLFGATLSFSAMVSSFFAMSSSFSPFLSLFCSLMVLFDPLFWSLLQFKGSSGDALFFGTSLLPDSFVFSDSSCECSSTPPFLFESQPLTLFRDVLPFSVIPSSFSPLLSAILSSFSVMSSSS